jgi:hypothetical protein
MAFILTFVGLFSFFAFVHMLLSIIVLPSWAPYSLQALGALPSLADA